MIIQLNDSDINLHQMKNQINKKIKKILHLLYYQDHTSTKNRKVQTQPDQYIKSHQQLTKITNQSQPISKKPQIILDDLFTTLIPPLQISASKKSIASTLTSRPNQPNQIYQKRHKGSLSQHTSQLSYDPNKKQRYFNKLMPEFNQTLQNKIDDYKQKSKSKEKEKQKIQKYLIKKQIIITKRQIVDNVKQQFNKNVKKHRRQTHQNYIARAKLLQKIVQSRKN